MRTLDLRFRSAPGGLLALPWSEPLDQWDATSVPLRDVPVGPSRHLVRFVEVEHKLWALKELPSAVAAKEYDALRHMEDRSLPAVRPAGVVIQPWDDTAILVTHYLNGSWQYRRLLMRVPTTMSKHRKRLLDAIAALVVDLHRNGIFWGDCSLANTLFMRDGQSLQAWMVDAETSEVHDQLSNGQRQLDLEILRENVLGGLLDVAARLEEEGDEVFDQLAAEAEGVTAHYRFLWDLLHEQPTITRHDPSRMDAHLRQLNDLGFAVDEVHLASPDGNADELRLKVDVSSRTFHARQLHSLTGLDVGEGQARILVSDLRAYRAALERAGTDVSEQAAARRWLAEVFTPAVARAHRALDLAGSPEQAYCDLLEVRWLLSEQAGHDVGDEPALEALAQRSAPSGSAANLGFVDLVTQRVPIVR